MHLSPRLLTLIILLLASEPMKAAIIPSPLPSATAQATIFPSQATSSSTPQPTLAPRCAPGGCEGGYTSVLQAATVTSTILSVTSVPCYITTYITDSKTVVSTIYNTQTITETMTKEGMVFVIQYEPKPILRTSMIKSVIPVTVDIPTVWLESGTVTPAQSTIKTEWKTIGGGVGSPAPTAGPIQPQPQPIQQSVPAWTHASVGSPVGASVQGGVGWVAGSVSIGIPQGTGVAVWGTGGHTAVASAASHKRSVDSHLGVLSLALTLGIFVVGELLHAGLVSIM